MQGLQLPPSQPACHGQYVLVGGIPGTWTVADVRGFFGNAVEASWFELFHYKHRRQAAEGASGVEAPSAAGVDDGDPAPRCCIVRVKQEFVSNVLRMYKDKNVGDCVGSAGAGGGGCRHLVTTG